MKIALAIIFLSLIFVPDIAFGWKSITYQSTCSLNCSNVALGISYSQPTNFILLVVIGVIGLCMFYKLTQTKKFEVFSIKCADCGKTTNGLKCQFCTVNKQNSM